MCSKIGLNEKYLRRYEEQNLVPIIEFDENAKSLLVIGCHADRRHVMRAAREKGLIVIHIDLEGYDNIDGTFTKYTIEGKKKK